MPRLLDNAAATGAAVTVQDGEHLFIVEGTFGGATVQLQYKGPAGTFIDIADTAFTAAGMINVQLPTGQVRATVTGGTPSALFADLLLSG